MTTVLALLAWIGARLGIKTTADLMRLLLPVLAVLALIFAILTYGNHRAHRAVLAERAQVAEREAKAQREQRARETAAAARRNQELTAARTRDAAQQQEITDATANLPDARPSDRARARICAELQQQARASGGISPACGHVRPR